MSLADDLAAASTTLPVRLTRQKDGSLGGEAVLAERKAFLSRKKLAYKCKARVDDAARVVRFWEILVEKGSGVSSGMDDMSPGFGFKAGTYKTGGTERSGGLMGGAAGGEDIIDEKQSCALQRLGESGAEGVAEIFTASGGGESDLFGSPADFSEPTVGEGFSENETPFSGEEFG